MLTNDITRVVCPPLTSINTNPGWRWDIIGKDTNIPQKYLINWEELPDEEVPKRLEAATYDSFACKTGCRCDKDGAIMGNPAFKKDKRFPKLMCDPEEFMPERCVHLLGCTCVVSLGQPLPKIKGATREDYQRALDSLPQIIREYNLGYQWRHAPNDLPGTSPMGFREPNLDRHEEPGGASNSGGDDSGPPLFGPGSEEQPPLLGQFVGSSSGSSSGGDDDMLDVEEEEDDLYYDPTADFGPYWWFWPRRGGGGGGSGFGGGAGSSGDNGGFGSGSSWKGGVPWGILPD
ncbi:hypothetical protein TWF730_004197 [Orbilia blumenaviensis]|uniref:Uncharacterized protein n=1 Tax=Orbilia blumenaviensis TaxID=1796055 RepID=A0AAV9TZH6_9PEZI